LQVTRRQLQKIKTAINTPVPHQTMRIGPDPPQSTLNKNSILHFTPVLTKHRNYLSPEERRRSAVGVEYYSTPGVLNRPALRRRPNYNCTLDTRDDA